MEGFVEASQLVAEGRGGARGGRRIFLSRRAFVDSHTPARHFRQEEEFAAIASTEFGFEVVFPEQLPWPDQVALFMDAEAIVGEFGSGLHAAMFSRPGTRIVSIGFGNLTQSYIAALRGHELAYLRTDGPLSAEFSADAEHFRRLMGEVFGGAPAGAERVPAAGAGTTSFYDPQRRLAAPPRAPLEVPEGFDDAAYLVINPDVRDAGLDPRVHYLNHGWHENRRWRWDHGS
jgi:hypothetical protein